MIAAQFDEGFTLVWLDEWTEICALTAEQPGQAQTALELGVGSVVDMNRDHDLAHVVVARMLGTESTVLRAAASQRASGEAEWDEEQAALALQKMLVAGVIIR